MALAIFAGSGHARDAAEPGVPTAEEAPIALMLDLSSGQTLFAREADRRFVPASIVKVMTTFLAFEWIEDGKLVLEQPFEVRPETFREWSGVGSTMFLPHDARPTVDELLHGVTTISANDASVVLAEGAAGSRSAWIDAMNDKAREIGMRDSHFGTANGWMDEGRTFTTARDLGQLAEAMLARHPSKYRHFVGAEGMEYNGIAQRNRDPISRVVEGADGIKTGFTNQSGFGFLGSAQRGPRRLVMVVAGMPNGSVRNRISRAFMEWGFGAFESRRLFEANAPIGEARVQDGDLSTVRLVSRSPVRLSLPHDALPEVDLAIRYEGPLKAPIARGEEVAELVISLDGEEVNAIPLQAEHAVLEATPLQRLFNGLKGWVT